ncbi:MAG: C40 family peptidase [Flavobacteriales bacterium]|nr:C40 family peptidase [Flavobacteriales bacterium]
MPVNAVTNVSADGERADLIDAYMHPFLGAPYLWGGRTPTGVDCSGLTQMLFMLMGIYLPRDAYQQAEEGDPVELVDLAEPGDLAFFDNAEGRITHVGIVLPERRILHASGRVRIDALDQEGIFDAEQGKYSHKLRLVKRVRRDSDLRGALPVSILSSYGAVPVSSHPPFSYGNPAPKQ